ncbi:uncharacterized protein SETTUDRAFT_93755 [Exserohilum turcica Et28A]|uniref:AB hydrolase-1 domain-containing protein n=1 Tax=Exserohilum turcicum (strain 28A) TaxID=671987 RepID=R0K6V7_EXST2|nr:uncharacterized protein SETTUDRAFT_93755 [Exserohilum turcica Et28A]EOA84037.1 hypothetical protein SETTUDRAFT_93755 [Exserohilum turcica Et28A]
MESTSPTMPITLDKRFHHSTPTHSFSIAWTALGSASNTPLIFIHGTPWSSHVWLPFARALSRKYRVYLCDNPGFGQSPAEKLESGTTGFKPESETERLDGDLARQSEAFAALFKHWGATEDWTTRPHVVAHDHGGLMSLRAHLVHECRYASLCLIDVVAIGPFGHALFQSVAENAGAFEKMPDVVFEDMLESYIRHAAYTALDSRTVEMLKAPWMREGGKAGFVRQLCQAAHRSTGEVEGRYADVGREMHIKIIWGKQDSWIPVSDAHRLGAALGAKEVVEVDGAGHLIMYDQPGQLGVELAVWLTAMGD